ncbi:MAG: hypothetical protein CSA33_01240 [Desulfobulbus propionicus]|nr:MAG: hypothetical protein CSA33_01240 [Desulfobulbus propionicus]
MIKKNPYCYTLSLFLLGITSAIVSVQIGITLYAGNPLCLNQGCEIVEQLALVPSLYINLAGLACMQLLFWTLRANRKEYDLSHRLYLLLLQAGISAEGVLVSFQYTIAHAFCSYCLFFFAVLVLLNILAGMRQTFQAAVLFSTILVTFSSLQFEQPASSGYLSEGVFAKRTGAQGGPQLQLFFAANCPHCEQIIDEVDALPFLNVTFHPIDTITDFNLSRTERYTPYSTDANRRILSALGIREVPALFLQQGKKMLILHGSDAIHEQLHQLSTGAVAETPWENGLKYQQSVTGSSGTENGDDGCTVGERCEEKPLIPGIPPAQAY